MDLNIPALIEVLRNSVRNIAQLDFLYKQLLLMPDLRQYLFDLSTEKRLQLLANFTLQIVPQSEFVFRKGDVSDCVYVLLDGTVGIYDGISVHSPLVATLSAGKVFGERGLVRKVARLFSARAITDCVLMQLSAAAFKALLEQAFRLRTDEKLIFINKHLPGAKNMFSTLKEKLAFSLSMTFCHKNQRLLAQGKTTEMLFFIIAGECIVSQNNHGVAKTVVVLTPGGLFGDECVLLDRPSSYSVDVSVDGTRVYTLSKRDAFQFIPDPVLQHMRSQCLQKFENRHSILRKQLPPVRSLSTQEHCPELVLKYASPDAKRRLMHARPSHQALNSQSEKTLLSLRLDLNHSTPWGRDSEEGRAKSWRLWRPPVS